MAIYNWESKPIDIDCPLDGIGLPSDAQWVGFDYWANACVPPFKGRLRTGPAQGVLPDPGSTAVCGPPDPGEYIAPHHARDCGRGGGEMGCG